MDEINSIELGGDVEWIQSVTPSPVSSELSEYLPESSLQAPVQNFYLMTNEDSYGALDGASIEDMFSITFVGMLGGFALALITLYACWAVRVAYNLLRKGV